MTIQSFFQIVAWHPLHVLLVAVVASHLVRAGLTHVARRARARISAPVTAAAPAA